MGLSVTVQAAPFLFLRYQNGYIDNNSSQEEH